MQNKWAVELSMIRHGNWILATFSKAYLLHGGIALGKLENHFRR